MRLQRSLPSTPATESSSSPLSLHTHTHTHTHQYWDSHSADTLHNVLNLALATLPAIGLCAELARYTVNLNLVLHGYCLSASNCTQWCCRQLQTARVRAHQQAHTSMNAHLLWGSGTSGPFRNAKYTRPHLASPNTLSATAVMQLSTARSSVNSELPSSAFIPFSALGALPLLSLA